MDRCLHVSVAHKANQAMLAADQLPSLVEVEDGPALPATALPRDGQDEMEVEHTSMAMENALSPAGTQCKPEHCSLPEPGDSAHREDAEEDIRHQMEIFEDEGIDCGTQEVEGPCLLDMACRSPLSGSDGASAMPAAGAGGSSKDTIGDYEVQEYVGGGGYAKVYAATREGFRVALKIEAFASVPDTTASSTRSNLGQDVSQADLPKPILTEGYLAFPCGAREHFRDFHAARSLLDPSGKGIPAHGIPGMYSVLCCLRGGYLHKVTVMQLLGPSLDEVAHEIARCPEAEAAQAKVETIGAQVLSIMAFIHQRRCVVRDVKPHNFCLGPEPSSTKVWIVDLAMVARHDEAAQEPWCGTPDFASYRALSGDGPTSYADDLESVLFCLLLISKGDLPWEAMSFDGTAESRTWTPSRLLAMGVRRETVLGEMRKEGLLPRWFDELLHYARKLAFGQRVDWRYVRQVFLDKEGPLPEFFTRMKRARGAGN